MLILINHSNLLIPPISVHYNKHKWKFIHIMKISHDHEPESDVVISASVLNFRVAKTGRVYNLA